MKPATAFDLTKAWKPHVDHGIEEKHALTTRCTCWSTIFWRTNRLC